MSIYKSYRKMCPDVIVNDFVTTIIKTVPMRVGYSTIRITLKSDKLTDKTLTSCALTALSVVCRKGCLVDIVDISVKSAPKNEKLRKCIPVARLFSREAYFYNTVLVELVEFQKGAGVRNEEGFQGAPVLIAATVEEGEEAIVLRNNGSEWTPRYEKWVGELTKEHVTVVLKEFARLHALSFAFGKTKPEKFEEFKIELQGGYLSSLENKHSLKVIRENLRATLKFFTDEEVKKLKKFDEEVDSLMENVLNGSTDGEVVVHGDVTTNILFCYEKNEDGNTVSRAKFIDWQLVKFGSPVLDLALFFFTNCSFDDLNNLQDFLNDYHRHLLQSLKEFNCDVNDFLSYEKLQEHWRKYAKLGLALTFLNFGVLSLEFGKRPNANVEDLSCEEFLQSFVRPPNDEFVRKIKDVVKYCVANGLV